MKAVFCKVNQAPVTIDLSDDPELAFDEVQKLVGGALERVRMGKFDICCDEEGHNKELRLNSRKLLDKQSPIVGPFVVLKYGPQELAGLSDSEAEWLCKDLAV